MSNIKSSYIKAKILFVIAVVGLFAILWKFGSEQNPHLDLNLTKGNANYSFAVDSCENFTGIDKAKCYFDGGNLNMSLKVCENLSGGDKDECLGRLAIYAAAFDVNTSVEVCSLLGHFSDANLNCFTAVASLLAVNDTKSAWNVCSMLGHKMCDNAVIRIRMNKNITEAVELCRSYDWWYDECECFGMLIKEIPGRTLEICGETHPKCRDDCLIYAASNTARSNPDYAAQICSNVSMYSIDACRTTIAAIISKNNKSQAFNVCSMIQKEQDRNFCYGKIKKTEYEEN